MSAKTWLIAGLLAIAIAVPAAAQQSTTTHSTTKTRVDV